MLALRRGTAISHETDAEAAHGFDAEAAHDITAEAAHDITAEAAHAKSIPKRRMASQPDLAGFVEVQLRSLTRRYSDGRAVGQANLRAVPVGGRVCAKLGSPHPGHICAGTGLIPATSAPGLGSLLPHLLQDWAHRCRICDQDWAHLLRLDDLVRLDCDRRPERALLVRLPRCGRRTRPLQRYI